MEHLQLEQQKQQYQYSKQEEQIRTLFRQDEVTDKKIEKLENDRQIMYSLDKNIALITKSLMDVGEYNKKQDTRMEEQHQINIKVNDNLTKLADQYVTLNNKVDAIGNKTEKLSNQVEDNESKHKLDLRDLDNEKNKSLLRKYGEPAIVLGAIGTILIQLLKLYKG